MAAEGKIESHRDLIVWQRAMEMSVAIYHLTAKFPREEMYGLSAQLRRAGVSVASNIAEGYGRASGGEYRHFLGIARGSNLEVETQLEIGRRLGLVENAEVEPIFAFCREVGHMLVSLMGRLR